MTFESKDNSEAILAKLKGNEVKALTAIGQTAVELTVDTMMKKNGRPIYLTGDIMRSISFNVEPGRSAIKIGSNLDYAVWVHNGTRYMVGRPFLKDAILDNIKCSPHT